MENDKNSSSKLDNSKPQNKLQGPDPKLVSHIELGDTPRQGPDPKLVSYIEKGFKPKK